MDKKFKQRLTWIDQAKGLVIISIILFHFFQNYPDRIDLVQTLDRNGARVGFAGVDLFFVIAGFNISYVFSSMLSSHKIESLEQIDWKLWLKKRLNRLYPTYWLSILISLILYYLFHKIEIKSFLDFIFILVGIPGYERFKTINPGLWFFSVILQAYLFTPILFKLCKNNFKLILILGIIGGLATKAFCWVYSSQNSWFLFFLQDNFLGSYWFQFCLGLYWGFIYYSYSLFRKIDVLLSIIAFVVGAVIYVYLTVNNVEFSYMIGFDMLLTPLLFLVIYGIFQSVNLRFAKIDILSYSGIFSYQLYLIHQPLLFVTLPALVNFFPINSYLRIVVSMLIITILLLVYVIAFHQTESFIREKFKQIIEP